MLKLATFSILLTISAFAHATFQTRDNLEMDGVIYELAERPLNSYLEANPFNFHEYCRSVASSNWDAHIPNWKIENGKLFLISIDGCIFSEKVNLLRELFKSTEDKILANWYTGTICLSSPFWKGPPRIKLPVIKVRDGNVVATQPDDHCY